MTLPARSEGLFLDRDVSALAFQRRVLALAEDRSVPLLERVRFIAIAAANIDEFLMTRVAGLQAAARRTGAAIDAGRVAGVLGQVHQVIAVAQRCFAMLKPSLAANGIHVLDYSELEPCEREAADAAFRARWLPAMPQLTLDDANLTPVVRNLDVHLVAAVHTASRRAFAVVPLPDALGSFVPVRRVTPRNWSGECHTAFVWLEQVAAAHLRSAAVDFAIESVRPFRVLREATLRQDTSAGSDIDYPLRVADAARLRHVNPVVALVVGDDLDDDTLRALQVHSTVDRPYVYRAGAVMGLRRLAELANLDYPRLRYTPLKVALPTAPDPFTVIRARDQFLHHPFDSFEPVVRLIESAASDEGVLDISAALYRTGYRSRIAEALVAAAAAGRHVHVVMEMHARFDEEANGLWATRLRSAGAEVTFGSAGRKVHAKLAVVTRDEGTALRRYVHVSSGNYNETTARQYTDYALLSCSAELAEDVLRVFDYLRGDHAGPLPTFRHLLVAPLTLRREFARRVRREMAHARTGRAHIALKMNRLTDPMAIRLLYEASQAGVDIDLIVRGACRLRPGVPGLSDRIQVRSHVGRFLEHGRAWYFHNGGDTDLLIGSADLRARGLDSRVEVMTPLLDRQLARRCFDEMLAEAVRDRSSWTLRPSGNYEPAVVDHARYRSESAVTRTGALA